MAPQEPLLPLRLDTEMGGGSVLRGYSDVYFGAKKREALTVKLLSGETDLTNVRVAPMAKVSPVVERLSGGK